MRRKHLKRVLRLRQLRRARELTQAEMASLVGIGINAYNAIETGRATPNLATAKAIAKVFGRPVEEVFEYVVIDREAVA
jgi:putative transcriptional regulator